MRCHYLIVKITYPGLVEYFHRLLPLVLALGFALLLRAVLIHHAVDRVGVRPLLPQAGLRLQQLPPCCHCEGKSCQDQGSRWLHLRPLFFSAADSWRALPCRRNSLRMNGAVAVPAAGPTGRLTLEVAHACRCGAHPQTQDRLLAYSNGLRPISRRGVFSPQGVSSTVSAQQPLTTFISTSDVRRHARLQGWSWHSWRINITIRIISVARICAVSRCPDCCDRWPQAVDAADGGNSGWPPIPHSQHDIIYRPMPDQQLFLGPGHLWTQDSASFLFFPVNFDLTSNFLKCTHANF